MEKACYGRANRKLVTVAEFLGIAGRDYKEKNIFPYCPSCGQVVDLYGAHSTTVTSRFDHKNADINANPVDECPLANRGDDRYRDLIPTDWDFEAGQRIRSDFFDNENIKIAYTFCLSLCGKGNLSNDIFQSLVFRADKKNIWSYSGIEVWVIPYILLTLGDFNAVSRQTSKPYGFHFILNKPRKGQIDSLWTNPQQCELIKVFSSNNAIMKWDNNPCEISLEMLKRVAGDTSWITDHFLRSLKKMA